MISINTALALLSTLSRASPQMDHLSMYRPRRPSRPVLPFNRDGTKLFVIGTNSDQVHQYTLSTAFDVTSGVTYDGSPYSVSFLDSQPKDLTFDPSGFKLFVLGGANETIYQFDLTTAFDITSGVTFNGVLFRFLPRRTTLKTWPSTLVVTSSSCLEAKSTNTASTINS